MTPRRRAACSACQGSRDPTWMRSRGRGVQRRQNVEDVALEGEVAHDEGPGEPELAGRPEQPLHGVGRADRDGVPVRWPEKCPVPELEAHRRRPAEEVDQQGLDRRGDPASRSGPDRWGSAAEAATGSAWK